MSTVVVESPYRGLRPFEDSDADALLFFGRELETELIAANLRAARLTVLYGPSGVGKSSVLRAGVMHRLRTEDDLVVRFESWSGDPVAGIAEAVRAEVSERLGDEVEDGGGPLATRLTAWTGLLGAEIYLVLDQVEEYFLYHGRNGHPDALMAELPDVVNDPGLRVNVLLGIREDALALLDAFKARIPQVLGNYLRLDRLDRGAGEAAILGPLAAWNELAGEEVAAEPALVEALLDEVSVEDGRIEAPYLQVVLERVWEAERAAGSSLLRRSTLASLGGAERIVDDHLERALAGLAGGERDTAAEMFAHLVTPGGTKIAHELHDLASYAGTDVGAVAAALVRERILRPVDGGTNGGRVEIYHDVLAGAVADWRLRHETERRLARDRRRQRRLAATVAVLVLGLALMTGLAAYAFSQRGAAREQAALAADQRAEAQRSARSATAAQKQAQAALADAKLQERKAETEAARARRAQDRASASAAAARAASDEAEANRRTAVAEAASADLAREQAEGAREDAEVQRDAAERAEAAAEESAREAQTQRGRAVAAQRAAERDKRIARVGELTAESAAQLLVDPEKSLRSAVRAAELAASLVVEDALRDALGKMRLTAKLGAGEGIVRRAMFSPDGRLVLTSADGGEARIFRAATGALLQTVRHGTPVGAAAFSPDGRVVATGDRNGLARLWSVDSGATVHTLRHRSPVRDLSFTPDGRLLLTATANPGAALHVWDAATGIELRRIPHPDSLRKAALSRDGRLVVTLTGDRFARVYDVSNGRLVAAPAQSGEITDVEFSADGTMLATAGRVNAFVWETGNWTQLRQLSGHNFVIRAVRFSPDGRRIVTASADGSGRVWDTQTGTTLSELGHGHSLTAAAFHPAGHTVATASRDRSARLWTGPQFTYPATLLVGHTEAVTSVDFDRTGSRLLTGSDDGTARIWDTFGEPYLSPLGTHGAPVTTAVFSTDGKTIVSAGLDGTARLWPSAGGAPRVLPQGARVIRAAITRDGRVVLTAGEDGTIKLWRAADSFLLRTLAHGSAIGAAALDPLGARAATGGADRSLRLWDAAGGQVWSRALPAAVSSIAFSSDGSLVAVGDAAGNARVLRARDGALVGELAPHTGAVAAVAFAPDGRHVATAGVDGVGHVASPRGTGTLSLGAHTAALTDVIFSPDGRILLTTSVDGDARLWEAATGEYLRTLSGHVSTIATASFSRDGRWIVTAGPGAGAIWQARTGDRLYFLRGHDGPLRAASFAPDSRRVVTGGADGTVRTYRCVLCGTLRELRPLAVARLRALDRASATTRSR